MTTRQRPEGDRSRTRVVAGGNDFANRVGKRGVSAMLQGEGAQRFLPGPALMSSQFLLKEQEGAPSPQAFQPPEHRVLLGLRARGVESGAPRMESLLPTPYFLNAGHVPQPL